MSELVRERESVCVDVCICVYICGLVSSEKDPTNLAAAAAAAANLFWTRSWPDLASMLHTSRQVPYFREDTLYTYEKKKSNNNNNTNTARYVPNVG